MQNTGKNVISLPSEAQFFKFRQSENRNDNNGSEMDDDNNSESENHDDLTQSVIFDENNAENENHDDLTEYVSLDSNSCSNYVSIQ